MLKKAIFILTLLIIVIVGIIVPTVLLTKNQTKTNTPPEPVQSETTKMLAVPGADPIPFEHLDFAQSSSIWVVVSKTRPLANMQYVPSDLIVPTVASNDQKSDEERSIRTVIEEPLRRLFRDAASSGHTLFIASGYRSYALQQQYYSNYVRTSGEAAANMFSAKPGHSEHQTGLAVDISLQSRQCYLDTCFAETTAGQWLKTHAHEYGFIIRYPAEKTEVTGYQYEPWHLRFVGDTLARALYASNTVLDEVVPIMEKTITE